jgi:hypothetical protein
MLLFAKDVSIRRVFKVCVCIVLLVYSKQLSFIVSGTGAPKDNMPSGDNDDIKLLLYVKFIKFGGGTRALDNIVYGICS